MDISERVQAFVDEWNTGHRVFLDKVGVSTSLIAVQESLHDMINPKTRDYLGLSLIGKHEALLALYKLGYREPIDNRLRHVFLTGHIFEAIILASMKGYGLDVRLEQEEVELGGFKGHIDAVVDSELYDVKTMSASHFKSFQRKPEDMMGYITQLVSYHNYLQGEVGENPGWIIFNKETAELGIVRLFDHIKLSEYDHYVNRVYEKSDFLDAIKTPNDVQLIYVPEPRPEVYQKQSTGKFLIPQPLYMTYYADAYYDTEPGTNSYGKETRYITRRKTPQETVQWLYENGLHLGDLIGYDS